MHGAWRALLLLLAGAGLLIVGLTLSFPSDAEWAAWAFIVTGIVALMLGSTQVELLIHTLHERLGRARPRSDVDAHD